MQTIVTQLIDCHIQLKTAADRKTAALAAADVKAVERETREELRLIGQVQLLERARLAEIERTTVGLQAGGTGWTFRKWIERIVPECERAEYHELRSRLGRIIEELKAVNQLNQQLLVQALRWTNFNLNMLQPQRVASLTYGQNGKKQGSAFSGRIDSKA
ncbi:MAG: flagellar protein FlgN [Sporolactobacillus sp.]